MAKDKKKQRWDTKSDRSNPDVTFDLSLLSLSDRIKRVLGPARTSELAGAAEFLPAKTEAALPFDRTGRRSDGEIVVVPPAAEPAVSLAPRDLPDRWSVLHVMDRLEEAMVIMARLPMSTRPKEFGNAMPAIVQQRFSLLDLIEMKDTGELVRMHNERNQVRAMPKPAQITRMEQALRWPADYLGGQPVVARAVGLGALWSSIGADHRRKCQQLGMKPKQIAEFQKNRMAGLSIIVARLVAAKVPVS